MASRNSFGWFRWQEVPDCVTWIEKNRGVVREECPLAFLSGNRPLSLADTLIRILSNFMKNSEPAKFGFTVMSIMTNNYCDAVSR